MPFSCFNRNGEVEKEPLKIKQARNLTASTRMEQQHRHDSLSLHWLHYSVPSRNICQTGARKSATPWTLIWAPASKQTHPGEPSRTYHQTNHILYCGAPMNAKHQRQRRNQAQQRTKKSRQQKFNRNLTKPPDNPRTNHRHCRAPKLTWRLLCRSRKGEVQHQSFHALFLMLQPKS